MSKQTKTLLLGAVGMIITALFASANGWQSIYWEFGGFLTFVACAMSLDEDSHGWDNSEEAGFAMACLTLCELMAWLSLPKFIPNLAGLIFIAGLALSALSRLPARQSRRTKVIGPLCNLA